ncbi:glycosyltransferase family 4 protein [Defluviimonas sp. WL0024]|uniref:Glycosyltransferase family 4 protein n=2 Tax=Albidovulum TaxID=205889 RepID=A0ABT3IYX7_9RHOB|nr:MULTISPECIES: glycosyltransferase family 4 protein [Defluviimonas]MCU9848371.1 glycosyltransferase family 4 protein [Defluviimonas sp. WL0024]MCW3780643.1 glycosyltransferase family 4 protein [Defluviimonas salinarum]
MPAHVLYVGGEDNNLRIPFILAMRRRGYRVTAAGSGDPAPFLSHGIDFVSFPFDRFISPGSDLRALRRLVAILRELQPDIAQGFDTKPCLLVPLASGLSGTGTKAVRTICGRSWVYSSRAPLAVATRPVLQTLHRLAARRTAATVFQIEDDRDFFRRNRIDGRRGVLIPAGGSGVDVKAFERALAELPSREAMRDELGLGDAEVVVTVSRMTRQKGIPTLLKAAAIVHRVRPGVRFVLVGPRESEGPLAVSAAEIEAHSPYVIATGARRDVPALMRMADVFAFPTEYREGVARALLEASLAGLPIVSSAMPGCREVIRDGWNGLLAPPGDPERLADGIIQVLEDPEAARAMAGRADAVAREQFSLEVMADRMAQLYDTILRDREDTMAELPAADEPTA